MVNKRMQIVVTGATGFLGSWVCRVLAESHQITALVRRDSSVKRLAGIAGLKVVAVSPIEWWREINKISPDVYISLEWEGVGNRDRNESFQYRNVLRANELLQKLEKIPLIVGTGSQAELGPVSELISESQLDAPTTEYGRAKVLSRNAFASHSKSHGTRFVWARVFSTYGPLDSSDWLIPATMKTLVSGKNMELTAGRQEWSFLHAFDLAMAYKRIVESDSMSGIVNIGNPTTIQVREIVCKIANIAGNHSLLKFDEIPYRQDQIMKLAPICESLTAHGWTPKVDIDSGLTHLFKWLIYQENSELELIDGTRLKLHLPAVS